MRYFILILFTALGHAAFAQQQTYDLLTFTPPPGWKQSTTENIIGFSTTNNTKQTWAQISIVKSTTSKGSIEGDFPSEWADLAVKPYHVSDKPSSIDKQVFNGWQFWTGLGSFNFNNQKANLLLNTFSDGQRCISFILMSNTTIYGKEFDEFIASISIQPPSSIQTTPTTPVVNNDSPPTQNPPATSVAGNFQFNTTNFDDGWISVEKPDWVEATKDNVVVILHYPKKELEEYIPQQDDHTRLAWNLLIAPRYTSASDFFLYSYNMSYEPAHLAYANLTDTQGRKKFVALFMKGKTGWIEIITPDKNTFVRTFGVDQPDSYFGEWDRLINLSGLNRFAVGEKDLMGKWTSDFSSSLQYYSSFTGMYAGYNAYSSREIFDFHEDKSYNWKISTANSVNGQTQAQNAESSGKFSMKGNWQVYFSKIETRPRTYNAYFSCIRGGRVLWLQDVEYGSYTAYGKVAQ